MGVKMKVIIAGSEGLIGKEVSKFFEKNGNEVIRCDLSLGHDLSSESFVKDFFAKNKADHLINLFAMNDHVDSNKKADNLFEISLESFNRYLNINVLSLFSVCREFARNNSKGTIVNFSSTYGITSPMPDLYPGKNEKHIGYGVSKAAVIQLTRHLAIHLAPNFTVNCVAPGGVKHEQDKNFIEKYSNKTPMGRMMNPTELNGLLEYLCSNKSSYLTGETISVDGGWTKW
tara:strand:- start:15947 stop:16636 length:690 start_codon:yes stop_codon:yes gene_type:complete